MIDFCSEYYLKWNILLNASKTTIVCFGKEIFKDSTFKVGYSSVKISKSLEHLGIIWNTEDKK